MWRGERPEGEGWVGDWEGRGSADPGEDGGKVCICGVDEGDEGAEEGVGFAEGRENVAHLGRWEKVSTEGRKLDDDNGFSCIEQRRRRR